jgi:hypothetical protein
MFILTRVEHFVWRVVEHKQPNARSEEELTGFILIADSNTGDCW